MKRVVVTGIGILSCLGNNQEEVYQSLINSKSGITFSEDKYFGHNQTAYQQISSRLKIHLLCFLI